jgi:Protein of unknown function (DUF1602).
MRKRGRRVVSVVERTTCPSIRPVAACACARATSREGRADALGIIASGMQKISERARRSISSRSRAGYRCTIVENCVFHASSTEERAVGPFGNIQYTEVDRLPQAGGSARLAVTCGRAHSARDGIRRLATTEVTGALPHDAPIEDLDAAIRMRLMPRIMRHHADRRSLLVQRPQQVHHGFAIHRVEIAVGSSARRMSGSPATARATATRCCWPPDSCAGKWFTRCPIPTRSSAPRTRRRRSVSLIRRYVNGSSTFSYTVRSPIRLNAWNTNPICLFRTLARSAAVRSVTGMPANV